MDCHSDPNSMLTCWDFIWFPKKPLSWGATYTVTVDYAIAGVPDRLKWSFTTKSLSGKSITLKDQSSQSVTVSAGKSYVLLLNSHALPAMINKLETTYRGGKERKCHTGIAAFNAVSVKTRFPCELLIELDNGQRYRVQVKTKG